MTDRYAEGSTPSNLRLDELDEQILSELSRDARLSNTALAAKVHVSPSTTHARVKALKDSGVIRSSHVELDYEALGLPVQGLVSVKLQAQARPQVRTYARKVVRLPNVRSVFFVGGQVDFLIHVVCTSTGQLRDFVASYISMDPVVASTETNIVFEHLGGAEHHGMQNIIQAMRKPFE
ncbi:Lrp/AsnC family transcriptional regulator [Demequina salsinemoris]|uniref:Lrp/AsnC family transcriptional regulator n=1 Tax=Demequina salsinemoris TaxID=577470 RepID=UPI00078267E2|nr:Lrp/AsnC family transcriptional regulator [Demequina salsinemoris]